MNENEPLLELEEEPEPFELDPTQPIMQMVKGEIDFNEIINL